MPWKIAYEIARLTDLYLQGKVLPFKLLRMARDNFLKKLSKLNKTQPDKTNYLSWHTLLISKLSTIIGKINSRPGSKSNANSILKF